MMACTAPRTVRYMYRGYPAASAARAQTRRGSSSCAGRRASLERGRRCEMRGLCRSGLGPLPHSRLAARTRLSRQETLVPDPHPAPRVIPHTHVVERPADRVLPVLLEVGGDLWENRREVCNFRLRHRHLHVAPGVRAAGGAPPSARGQPSRHAMTPRVPAGTQQPCPFQHAERTSASPSL